MCSYCGWLHRGSRYLRTWLHLKGNNFEGQLSILLDVLIGKDENSDWLTIWGDRSMPCVTHLISNLFLISITIDSFLVLAVNKKGITWYLKFSIQSIGHHEDLGNAIADSPLFSPSPPSSQLLLWWPPIHASAIHALCLLSIPKHPLSPSLGFLSNFLGFTHLYPFIHMHAHITG